MVKDSRFLQALRAENRGRPPVWLMRQAGRYLSSYRKLRSRYTLSEMFHTSDLIEEVTMLPVDELGVDAAILFSDILLPLEHIGFSVEYEKGPKVKASLCKEEEVSMEERFSFLTSAIVNLKKRLSVPLLGFAGAPFTIASYVLDHDKHHLLQKTKQALYQTPSTFFSLLDRLADLVIAYLHRQIRAGVDVVQIFDSWAGVLEEEQFAKCSVHYLHKIIEAIRPTKVPVIVFCRGSSLFAEQLAHLKPNGISFDWHRPLDKLKTQVPYPIAIQGNLDPDVLKAPFAEITRKTKQMLSFMEGERRFIAGLGHGVTPEISEEAVKCFVSTVQES